MAIHHPTPPFRGGERPRLPSPQLSPKLGPVTQAIRAMRADNLDLDRERIRDLRRRISERIEADIALLDALDGDCDLEDGADLEPSLCGTVVGWPCQGGDDREDGDDNGIADWGGAYDQAQRFLENGGDMFTASRLHWGHL